MVAGFKDSSACTCARLPVQAMVQRLVSLQIFHVFVSWFLLEETPAMSSVRLKALMASETVGSKRQMASSDAAVFCNGLGRKHRRRQSLRLAGLTLRWHETVSAAYVISDCNLEITGFVAQKLIGLPPNHCDYPTQDLVEEIAVSVPLDAVFSRRAQKEAAELLVVRQIQTLNLRGVVPTSAAVYNMFQALQPSPSQIGHRARDAWVQRFRKRWQLSRRAWPQKPDLTDEAAKNKAGGPKIGAFQWF